MKDEKIIETYKVVDLDRNPHGTDLKVSRQREREKNGRYYPVGDKCHTLVFVRAGEDADKKIAQYLEKVNNRPLLWN